MKNDLFLFSNNSKRKKEIESRYLFSVKITVLFRYIGILCCKPLVTTIKGVWLPNNTSIMKLLIILTVELVGAKKVACGFVLILISTFSLVTLLFDNETIALLLSLWIWLFVGNPIRNEPTSKVLILELNCNKIH